MYFLSNIQLRLKTLNISKLSAFLGPPFKQRSHNQKLTSKNEQPDQIRDVDYRAINSPVKAQYVPDQVVRDTDLRKQLPASGSCELSQFSHQGRPTNWSKPPSDPPFKRRSTIKIAPLTSRGNNEIGAGELSYITDRYF